MHILQVATGPGFNSIPPANGSRYIKHTMIKPYLLAGLQLIKSMCIALGSGVYESAAQRERENQTFMRFEQVTSDKKLHSQHSKMIQVDKKNNDDLLPICNS